MKKIFLILSFICILSSCALKAQKGTVKEAEGSIPGNDFELEYLFTVDDVKVYRFYDAGHYRYFTTGSGSYQPQRITKSTGKTVTVWEDGGKSE